MLRFVTACTRERVIRAATEAADCDASREIMVQTNNEAILDDAFKSFACVCVCVCTVQYRTPST